MEGVKRAALVAAVFCLANLLLLFGELIVLPGWLTAVVLGGLALFYVSFHIRPRWEQAATPRLRTLLGGYELLVVAFWTILATGVFYGVLYLTGALAAMAAPAPAWMVPVVGALVYVPVILLLLVNGFSGCCSPATACGWCGGCCCSSPGGCRCSTSTSSTGC